MTYPNTHAHMAPSDRRNILIYRYHISSPKSSFYRTVYIVHTHQDGQIMNRIPLQTSCFLQTMTFFHIPETFSFFFLSSD